MLHGLGGSSRNWSQLTPLLSDRLDCWVPDLPGFGWSPPSRDGDLSPRANARAMAELIEWIGRGPVHLFGNSMGGAIAVQLAARRPDLVRTLTLLSPALPRLVPSRDAIVLPLLAIPGVGEWLMPKAERATPEQRVHGLVRLVFGDPDSVGDEYLQEAIEDLKARSGLPYANDAFLRSLRGLIATFLDRGPERPWKLAERITAPTLVVYGQKDRLVDAVAAHKVTRHFRDAHVLVIPESGHVAMMEHPEIVDIAWQSLVEGVSA